MGQTHTRTRSQWQARTSVRCAWRRVAAIVSHCLVAISSCRQLVYQTCQPELTLGQAHLLFTLGIIANQLTFATTSILNHTRLGGMMSRNARSIAAYALALCSFLFGFCKILIVVSLTTIADFGFVCPTTAPSSLFTSSVCSEKSAYVDCTIMGGSTEDICEITQCSRSCSYQVPIEVLILSATFGLTFIYSLFMCDLLLNRPDEVMSLIERQQQRNRDLIDPIKANKDVADEDEEEEDQEDPLKRQAKEDARRAAKKERRTAQYGAIAVADPSVAAQISDQLLFDDGEPGEADEESEAAQAQHRRAAARMEQEMTRIPRAPASQHDMIELDPLSKKAFDIAQSLTAQELLLCMIESDYRKHLTSQLRMRDIFYRLLRDIATLAKFALTMASICLIIFGRSIIFCDQDEQLFALGGISPTSLFSQCMPSLSSQQPNFFFTVFGVGVSLAFVFIIVMEKRVLAPAQATWLSALCIAVVTTFLCVQLFIMTTIEVRRQTRARIR